VKKQYAVIHWTDASIEQTESFSEEDLKNVELVDGIAVGIIIKEDKKSISLATDWFPNHKSYRQIATYPKSGIHKIIRKDIDLKEIKL